MIIALNSEKSLQNSNSFYGKNLRDIKDIKDIC